MSSGKNPTHGHSANLRPKRSPTPPAEDGAEKQDPLTKWSFLLPTPLADKVQLLAELRGVKLSKAIRDVLEENVDRLIKQARTGVDVYETTVSASGLLLVKVDELVKKALEEIVREDGVPPAATASQALADSVPGLLKTSRERRRRRQEELALLLEEVPPPTPEPEPQAPLPPPAAS
jgi:hypothetical protein